MRATSNLYARSFTLVDHSGATGYRCRMNPLRRMLELAGLKPKERKKRLPILTSSVNRLKRRP